MTLNCVLQGDVLERLRDIPDESIHCVVTSPPYWALRDYGVGGQLGLESTPEEYITKMVEVFRDVKRVLMDDGTLWLNIGDSYASKSMGDIKAKDMIGVPWMLAFALRADGWYLRQDIIWHKPNPMPESTTDRCTKAHEYIFMLSKSSRYYYDAFAIKTPYAEKTYHRNGREKGRSAKDKQRGHVRRHDGFNDRWDRMNKEQQQEMGANKRSVWTIATRPFPEAHFATFPEEIPEICIKAGCPPGGIVLDPFFGAGTTGIVANKLERDFIGIELNPAYIEIAKRRFENEFGMFNKLR